MEETPRDKSSDSIATSEEFEDLGPVKNVENGLSQLEITSSTMDEALNKPSPEMEIGNNGNMADLQDTLDEVLKEDSQATTVIQKEEIPKEEISKPISNEENSEVTKSSESLVNDDSCTVFNQIAYLGSATVNAPRSESELQRNMAILSRQSSGQPIEVTLLIPSSADGTVILLEAGSNLEMAAHPIHRIIFFARGPADTLDSSCFAFTCPRGDSEDTSVFQCHVFRCEIPEAVSKVMSCFVQAFRKPEIPPSPKSVPPSSSTIDSKHQLTFELTLEIQEDDGKGNYNAVPRDRSFFKIRAGIEKKIIITVVQLSDNNLELPIERCFGLLVSPGRNVKHSDMHLLEMVSMGTNQPSLQHEKRSAYVISGHWDPNELVFGILNRESSKEINCVFITIAVDLVIKGISEPVRFVVETKVKVFGHNERFWYYSQKQMCLQYTLQLNEVREPKNGPDRCFQVTEICNHGEIDRPAKSKVFLSRKSHV